MRRFYIKDIDIKNGSCFISGSEARHIIKVLRMGKGDRLALMDEEGRRFQVLIESYESNKVYVTIEKELPAPPESPIEIILCQSILKSNSMDYMFQKTSELGVNRIIPFSSNRTIVRLKGDRAANRMRHWRQISMSSAKQSDRSKPAIVEPPIMFNKMIEGLKKADALKIILWEEETGKNLKSILEKVVPSQKVICIVGPEGGFTDDELDYALGADFISISLGNRILRAETAAITICAIIQYEWGDLGIPT